MISLPAVLLLVLGLLLTVLAEDLLLVLPVLEPALFYESPFLMILS